MTWREIANANADLTQSALRQLRERDLDLDIHKEALQQYMIASAREIERLRAALRRTADAPCSHCTATDLHGEINTAHFLADQGLALGSAKDR